MLEKLLPLYYYLSHSFFSLLLIIPQNFNGHLYKHIHGLRRLYAFAHAQYLYFWAGAGRGGEGQRVTPHTVLYCIYMRRGIDMV